ncbi:hypothetical protein PRIPAC_78726 [Pristionchus pacificus]|uniref:Dhs-19 n=1 Tax=Pristionchus pacificus TaxID=54126 RepID=A0A2A6BY03_PRIPA|nr:hypothetical protein PRIPAC_78726 [Pristionchus pacificus]|eukprot:PDM70814.1 dhs-19 [Pristionchus pacificus]
MCSRVRRYQLILEDNAKNAISALATTMSLVVDSLLSIGEFGWTVAQLLTFTLIDSVKTFIPMGVLPRKSIKGDICLITGAGSGLGRLMALEFAKHGCDIVLWDVNEAGNAETKRMLKSSGARVWSYTVDLADRKDIAAKAVMVKEEVGGIEILSGAELTGDVPSLTMTKIIRIQVNNAGIVTGKKLFDCTDDEMEKTMAVNCNACLYTMRHFGQSMVERNHGHIITIASIAGKLGVAGLVDYCASKHGAVGFHEAMSEELRLIKADGVKTSLICPYYTNTGMFDGVVTNAPYLLPILDSSYVIDCIMEAVLTNKQEYFIPKFLYLTTSTFGFYSNRVSALMSDYFKIGETMNNFKGRKAIEEKK